MRRDQLEHAIRTACQIIRQPELIVVGSQAILGTYDESAPCPTDSSASSTAAYDTALSTTKPSPGPTAARQPLDDLRLWDI